MLHRLIRSCLDTICDPNGGPAMIAWLLAFLGFPPPAWDTRIAKPALLLLPCLVTVRRRRSRREPMRILSENKTGVNRLEKILKVIRRVKWNLNYVLIHHTVGAPSFASFQIAYLNTTARGRKGWVNKTSNAND